MSKNKDSNLQKHKLWTFNYILIIIVNTFSAFSFYMISSILSKYLVGLGTKLTVAGIIVGIFSITALVIRPFSGIAADRFNKKAILIITAFLIGICVFGYTISTSIQVILIFRIIHGIAFGMNGTATVALAAECIPKERMGEGIGYLGIGQLIPAAVAPGFGIMIAAQYGIRYTFIVACIMAVCGASCMVLFKNNKENVVKLKKKFSFDQIISRQAIPFSFIAGLFSFINGVIASFLLLIADQRHIGGISIYFTVCAVVMLLMRPFAGKIMDRKGLSVLVYPCFFIGILGMIFHGLASTLGIFLVAAVLRSIAQAGIQPSLQAACIKKVNKDSVGVATSTFYIGGDIGQGIGPIAGAMIATSCGYSAMLYFCAGLIALGCLMYFWIEDKNKIFTKEKIDSQIDY